MDPIRNLISGTDPLTTDRSAIPDAEAVLRLIVTDRGETADKLPPNVRSIADTRRQRVMRVAGLLTIAAAAVTAGVLVTANLGSLKGAPVPANTVVTSSPTATASASPSAIASATPTSSTSNEPVAPPVVPWKTFTDATGQATFDLPENWYPVESTTMIGGRPYNSVSVRNAGGKQLATMALHYDLTAGRCAASKPFTTLDAVNLDIPQKADKVQEFSASKGAPLGPSRFTFTVVEGTKVYGSLGLSEAHQKDGTPACSYWNTIVAPDGVPVTSFGDVLDLEADGAGAPLVFDTIAEAREYMQTQEYQDMKRMMVSLSLKPSNVVTSTPFSSTRAKVQFSLPTGWTAADVPAGTADFPATGVQVSDETGKKVASLYYGAGGGLGGACGPSEHYPVTELDTAASNLVANQWAVTAGVRFSYRVLDQRAAGKGLSYEVGLVDKSSGAPTATCPNLMYAVVNGAPKGSLSFADRSTQAPGAPVFATIEDAMAYMGTPEYRKLKEMITSFKVTE